VHCGLLDSGVGWAFRSQSSIHMDGQDELAEEEILKILSIHKSHRRIHP
jgi:hypothetical protein